MTYQILAVARDKYEVPPPFVDEIGAVRFSVREEVRRLEYLMRSRGAAGEALARTAGGLLALGILNDVQRHLLGLYRAEKPRDPLEEASSSIAAGVGAGALNGCYRAYVRLFPPREPEPSLPERRGPDLLAELVFLSVANRNPAAASFQELFADGELRDGTAYDAILTNMDSWAGAAGPALGWREGIVALLMAPILRAPHSLLEQLQFIRERWGHLLGDLLRELLLAIDVLREESRPRFGGGPGPAALPRYGRLDEEPERYSPDVAWMPRVVLIAKHALVWLHQLSEKHGRAIRRLDEVPDAELDELSGSGFTGLWLIGIWTRSPASQTIKRRCGNPEAVGSAYAIVEYRVSSDLGGEEAARSLSERAAARGLRLACDMVPNHTALDSHWVADHPDWFVQTPSPPFPGYRFSREAVGGDSRMEVRIEDHYYDRSDAAVVFERREGGGSRYLYHGNDGTSTPWNDTAQLDFLKPEVRDAVVGQILSAAHAFPIIRFDAAMVLTRKHFQRLWYPPPGSGGDIPSRAERGLDPQEFDRRMPAEFWREVVDRVAAQAPETLLLAEAFWLLEGYFVRTLGMHRVYNSAFMNMLKTEDNARYRQLIKSTLEYDPEILKRYVNFMSNPDEEPAAVQFGSGDKYFGIAVMMATLPGLPMFGHGQVEGFAEKYGMEYNRSYRSEQADPAFVERHRREIFPLLRLRSLFAEVASFRLYDLYGADGTVNEDVFAYSNRIGDSFALVVYNNRYQRADGTLSQSAAFRDRARGLVRRSLAEEIGLTDDPRCFCVFSDSASGLEYIRPSRLLISQGLQVGLDAFHYHVFLSFRERRDNRLGHYARLAAELGGAGTPSVERAVESYLAPVHDALRTMVRMGSGATPATLLRGTATLHQAIRDAFSLAPPRKASADPRLRRLSAALRRLSPGATRGSAPRPRLPAGLGTCLRREPWLVPLLAARAVLAAVEEDVRAEGWSVGAELRLPDAFRRALLEAGAAEAEADRAGALFVLLASGPLPAFAPEALLATPGLRAYLGVNWFDGSEWFRKEPLDDLCRFAQLVSLGLPAKDADAADRAAARILKAGEKAGYRVEAFLQATATRKGSS